MTVSISWRAPSGGTRRSDEARLKLRITVPRMDAQSADVAQW
jgi:hypothetical protein